MTKEMQINSVVLYDDHLRTLMRGRFVKFRWRQRRIKKFSTTRCCFVRTSSVGGRVWSVFAKTRSLRRAIDLLLAEGLRRSSVALDRTLESKLNVIRMYAAIRVSSGAICH